MGKMLNSEAVEKAIKEYFKRKVGDSPKELELNSHNSLGWMYVDISHDLINEIRQL